MNMTLEELKLRRLTNQHLLAPTESLSAVKDLCGLQAQYMGNALHALKLRASDYDGGAVPAGLVKNWTIRGTLHLFAESDLPLFLHCGNGARYRSQDWTVPSFWNRREGWSLTPERQRYFSEVILEALEARPHTREELKALCRARGMTDAEAGSMFDPWGGGIRELCERGFLNCTAREGQEYCLAPAFTPVPEEAAKLELARRYFTHFGPATVRDAAYFFHAPQAQVKGWLSKLPVQAAECDGKTYFCIENGQQASRALPGCLFLAGFDQLLLGYEKRESVYLKPEHLRGIFSLGGIVFPAVLLHGTVVGRWKKKGRTLTVALFAPVSEQERRIIRTSAEALWNGEVSVELMTL